MTWVLVLCAVPLGSGCIIESSRHASDLYEGCRDTDDCTPSADACFQVTWDMGDGKMCSLDCASDVDCPGPSRCYALVGDPTDRRICYARCESDFDCHPGFQCVTATIDGTPVDAICMPL